MVCSTECGYAPQYGGLQSLYDKYKDRGHGVTFPMMSKVHARGPEIAPVYKALTQDTPEGIRGEVKWNFTKFLIDTQGQVVARFEPKIDPLSPAVTGAIEKTLPR